jgi:hypothetical protein
MTYIRMTGGRDRGYVKDVPFLEAQEMLRLEQATEVNFDEVDALGFRETKPGPTDLFQVRAENPVVAAPEIKKKKR